MKYAVFIVTTFLITASPALAGPGHDHGPAGDQAGGPLAEIVLSDAMIANLGIKTVPASLQRVSKTIDLVANIDYLPEKQAIVSPRADGSISKIMVKTGQKVKRGEEVIVFQPRLVGNPPVVLTSPMDGYVTEQNVVIGQSVTPDHPLLKIADLSEVLVRGQAYEDVPQSALTVGRPVMVTTASFPGDIFEGEVQRADAAFRPGLRVREVWAVVDNPEGKLLANMQAQLSVKVGDATDSIIVPQRAILGDTGNYFLYVRDDDHFYRRDITIGQKYGASRAIINGVSEGDNIVTVGNYQLQFVTSAGEAAAEGVDAHKHDEEDGHSHEPGHDHSHDESEGHSHDDGHDHSEEDDHDHDDGHAH